MRFRKLTIIQAPVPTERSVNEQLQWLGGSLGLFSLRDRDKSCFRVFVALLKGVKGQEEFSSDELAARTGLTRGTVIHHLNKLIGAGLVEGYRSRYVLRVHRLSELIEKLEDDMEKTVKDLKDVASELDRKLGL